MDLRNHGRSPWDEQVTYRHMAEDVLETLDDLGIERAHVIGHSMGGKVAMTAALQAPERVSRCCAADIAPVSYGHGHDRIIDALQSVDTAALESRQDADDALAREIPEAMVRQFLLTNLIGGDDGYAWRIPLDTLAAALPEIEGFPDFHTPFTGPALFVYGGESDYMDAEGERAARALFPEARLQCIEGAGHWLHVEAADAFARTLDAFLAEPT
jgi:esterase